MAKVVIKYVRNLEYRAEGGQVLKKANVDPKPQ
jgi:hypothetical protein